MSFSTDPNTDGFDNEFDDIGDIEPSQLDLKRKGKGDNLKYLIIDVREPHELENDNDLGSTTQDWINIPKENLLSLSDSEEFEELLAKNGIDGLDEYQDLFFFCRSGQRSMNVAKHIVQLDLDQTIFNVTGGILKYQKDCDNAGLR
eukprot:CAMPEP_0202687726 /NCGR_PEP_ID=MMETSP1385-20130828/3368_1 /ASSEMBLY_ACC=CAM_ASM_000861 /TAXON_ID=933848 /ORGANISM="Elphidium margaritaceum" /LENGTH=145 /DNA_ID=CAMNT_0049342565 /DNA_START=199 /DNA_END=636 /DNA_ORIENTATION=+